MNGRLRAAPATDAMQGVDPLYDRGEWNRWRFFGIRYQAASAEFWMSRRNLDRAEEHGRRLLKNSEDYKAPKYVSIAGRLLGEIAIVRGDLKSAEEELTQSLEQFETNPMPLVEWRNHAAMGRLKARQRRPAAARAAFAQAKAVIEKIAAHVSDEGLRQRFLEMEPVRQVLEGAATSENQRRLRPARRAAAAKLTGNSIDQT
jgi:hypothetical protein